MIIDKVKYTAQYEAGRKVCDWIGLEATLESGESADDCFQKTIAKVKEWHQMANPEIQEQLGIITVTRESVAHDPSIDIEFEAVKDKLNAFEFREDAEEYLMTTDFKHTIEAKKIINSKPTKK